MADTAYDADHLRQVIATKGGARRHPQQSVTCAQISARHLGYMNFSNALFGSE